MKKCLIVCWYGKLPDYYKYWEYSCSKNEDYDFLLFTDQELVSEYSNIIIYNLSIEDINMMFSNKLNIPINIEKPYKFCDFRPAYGIVFEDYLKDYDFWGHCDIDQIFGKINHFITDDVLNKYDVINKNGHFKLYRNIEKINTLFMKSGSVFSYDEVFTSSGNYAFDEFTGINKIIDVNHVNSVFINDFSDISVKHKRFLCDNNINYKNQIYSYENGIIYKYYFQNEKLKKEEKMYLHFQKKKPNISSYISFNKFLIGSKGFCDFKDINYDIINEYNGFYSKSFEIIEIFKYYFDKVLSFFKMSFKDKKIFIIKKIRG